ncbi:hypothetical protein An16g01160 [Aspergillus niger]|uniref:Uncharacterized protein n=2 Tax=Aspergillus niger TaxID=5061 RepID=A2R6T1_ASPNC|nr:hypothetical protein An16g01160 [Aspergillus niger]CAK97711.1 hypothetical protein An16g01160 [Aspergillus niger]
MEWGCRASEPRLGNSFAPGLGWTKDLGEGLARSSLAVRDKNIVITVPQKVAATSSPAQDSPKRLLTLPRRSSFHRGTRLKECSLDVPATCPEDPCLLQSATCKVLV